MTDLAGEVAALRRWHDEAVELVDGLSSDQLRATSGSSEWTLADVLSHLGSGAEIAHHTLTTGRADMDGARSIWDRWNAMTPADQAATFVDTDRRLVEAVEAIPAGERAGKMFDVGFLPAPVNLGFFLAMRLSEAGLHLWDIQVAFDPGATVVDYVVPFVLDLLPSFAPFFAKPAGVLGRAAVELVDPDRRLALEITPEGATLGDGDGGGDAPTRVRMPGEAFLRLTSGRLKPDVTPASVSVEGELSLDQLRAVFPGY